MSDLLGLGELFQGAEAWRPLLEPALLRQSDAATFIGPKRDKAIVPVRELTFQALKPNPPQRWRVVVFGQNPYPRVESATGIAMFDNAFKEWSDSRFGSVTSIRCIVKAACMWKHKVDKATTVASLRSLLAQKDIVAPPRWFQAMLTQGVLLLNASLTASADQSIATAQHATFWKPIIEQIVREILRAKHESSDPAEKGVVFAWWGSHAKALRKLVERLAPLYPSVDVRHVDHCNPAAMGDAFCEGDPFGQINAALTEAGAPAIDWLPATGWEAGHATHEAGRMKAFVDETIALHQLYLERLAEVKEEKLEELASIEGIGVVPLMPFSDAVATMASVLKGLSPVVRAAEAYGRKAAELASHLNAHEIAALHLYTMESSVYRQLNAALRHPDRQHVVPYFGFLRLFLSAVSKLEAVPRSLWRGVALDLRAQYPTGRRVVWWGVSSCTPSLQVARGFLGSRGKRTLFEVVTRRAVSIKAFSAFTGEDELILPPGTALKVASVRHEADGLSHIKLEELDSPLCVN